MLRYRQLLVEAEEAKLEAATARVRGIELRIGALEQESAGTAAAVRAFLAAEREIESAHLAAYPDYRFLLARNRQGLEEERHRALAEVEQQRLRLLEVRRAHEVLLRAREIAKEKWQAEFRKDQELMAGELFLSSWGRGGNRPNE